MKMENAELYRKQAVLLIFNFQLSTLNLIKSLGLPEGFTWMSVSLSRLIHCFMQVVIMFRRLLAMNSIKQDEQAKKHKQDKEIAEKVEKYNETHK